MSSSKKSFKKYFKRYSVVLFLIAMALIIRPWRNSVSQDDSAYTYSAISWSKGSSEVHAGNVAMVWPQLALGAAALVASPFEDLSTLNFLTWLCFSGVVLLSARIFRWPPLMILTFFSFPIWIQYASSYLTETYTSLILILLAVTLTLRLNSFRLLWIFLLSAMMGAQVQNMAAIPFFWGLFYFGPRHNRRLGSALIIGALTPIILFILMKKTPYQQGYGYWMFQYWVKKGAGAPLDFLLHTIELTLAIGLYFIPALNYRRLTLKSVAGLLVFQSLFVLIYFKLGYPALSSGVFFISQFSYVLSLIFVSFGVWGLWGIYQAIRSSDWSSSWRSQTIPVEGTLIAGLIMLTFCTYRMCIDIRYFVPWMILILIHIAPILKFNARDLLASKYFVFIPYLIASLVLNLYSLNTTDARWNLARELIAKGTPADMVSAGLGFDSFHHETECVNRILTHLESTEKTPIWKSQAFFDRIINKYNRSHADEWIPEYIVKPSQFLGHKLNLQQNRLPGQENEPVARVDYTVLGLPNQLALYHNERPQLAWCFRLSTVR